MKLPQLLHSTRSYGRANSAFSWKLLVLERGFLSYRLKLPCDRSEKDAWFGYSPVGALRKLPFILYSRPAEDWLQRSGSSSTISPTTLFMAARGRRGCSRSSTRRGSREYATTPASMPSVAGTSRVSRGTAADRLAIRIWDSADLLAYQRPLSARPRPWRPLRQRTVHHSVKPFAVRARSSIAFDRSERLKPTHCRTSFPSTATTAHAPIQTFAPMASGAQWGGKKAVLTLRSLERGMYSGR
jgi:hypothetical protein